MRRQPNSSYYPGLRSYAFSVVEMTKEARVERRPEDVVLILYPNGAFNYTPDGGFAGSDSFSYVVSDGRFS